MSQISRKVRIISHTVRIIAHNVRIISVPNSLNLSMTSSIVCSQKKVDVDPKIGNVLTCPNCYKTMRTNVTFTRHIRQAHGRNYRFTCIYCDKTVCAKFSWTYHKKKKNQEIAATSSMGDVGLPHILKGMVITIHHLYIIIIIILNYP